METEKGTNWITERANCNMDSLFYNLQGLVEHNVEMMKVESKKRQWPDSWEYTVEDNAPPTFVVKRIGATSSAICRFKHDKERDQIAVTMPREQYIIQTRWDSEALRCCVIAGAAFKDPIEFPHDHLWKIVQHILEPFFFPPAE